MRWRDGSASPVACPGLPSSDGGTATSRALELCNLSREGLDALADAVGPRGPLAEDRLGALVEAWAQIAKALWGDVPKPGLDEAIASNLASAEDFMRLAPDRREAR